MVPVIVSHDGAVHKDSVKRWKNFAADIKIDWVRIAQSVLRYNVVIVGKFFNKGSWMSEAWKKDHPEEFDGKDDCPPERIPTTQERMELLHLEIDRDSAVCVRSSDTPPPHDAGLTSAGRGTPTLSNGQTNQPGPSLVR